MPGTDRQPSLLTKRSSVRATHVGLTRTVRFSGVVPLAGVTASHVPPDEVDAVALNTRVGRTLFELDGPIDVISRSDSTLRGNVIAEVAALVFPVVRGRVDDAQVGGRGRVEELRGLQDQVAEVDQPVRHGRRPRADHVVAGDVAVDHLNRQVVGQIGDRPPGRRGRPRTVRAPVVAEDDLVTILAERAKQLLEGVGDQSVIAGQWRLHGVRHRHGDRRRCADVPRRVGLLGARRVGPR